MNVVHNMDCMDALPLYEDNHFDLAIVDPPYGLVKKGGYQTNQSGGSSNPSHYENLNIWKQSAPSQEYFDELFRVSRNQIIWGGNYFISKIKRDSICWIVWDKKHPENLKFSDCELAWTSFDTRARTFRYLWNGLAREKGYKDGKRIHPTQKPTDLYKWILKNYAKPGDRILDTHVGSGSSRIACYDLGFDFVGYEIDKGYYSDQEKRYEEHTAQTRLEDIICD